MGTMGMLFKYLALSSKTYGHRKRVSSSFGHAEITVQKAEQRAKTGLSFEQDRPIRNKVQRRKKMNKKCLMQCLFQDFC